MAEIGNSEEIESKFQNYHISCASSVYETGKDYIGLVLFEWDGNTKWEVNGRRCQSGYVIFLETGMLMETSAELESNASEEKLHPLGYRFVFGYGTMDKIAGEGFNVRGGVFAWEEDVFKRSMPLTNAVRQKLVDVSNLWKTAGNECNILPNKRNYPVYE